VRRLSRLQQSGALTWLAGVWRQHRIPCATCPAVPTALVLAAGIRAGVAWSEAPAAPWQGLAWLLLGAAGTMAVTPWRAWRLAVLPAGVALAVVHQVAPWDTLASHLPRPACRLTLRAVVADALCTGEALDFLPPPAAAVVAVRSLRLPGQPQWRPATGKVLLLLPESCRVAYGDHILAEGLALPAEQPSFPHAFDYRTYLRRSGVRHAIQAEQVRVQGPPVGLRRAVRRLLDCRDLLADRLVAQVPSAENAGILLAMTFGFRQTLPAATRDAFLRSGAIHVFSVSGLHVVIVATVLGSTLLMTGMPYRWRYAMLPLLLGAYVVMAGSAPSAIRAWLMVSIVCLARARLLAFSPLNSIALAAVALLVWNPLELLQAGFLYSFTTVSVLVLGWSLVNDVSSDLTERARWLPRALRPRRWLRATRNLLRALGTGLLAWFGGAGLMLYLSGLVVPAALPVNLVLVLVANLLLVLAIPKMLLACLPVALPDIVAGRLMGIAIDFLEMLVQFGSMPAGSWAVPVPPVALVAVYHLALFAVFLPRLSGSWRLGSLGLATLALAAATWLPWQTPCTALIWGGDCEVPVIVMERHDGLPPIVVHSGTTEAHRVLVNWLQRRGYRQVDALIFAMDSRRASETAPQAARRLQAATVVLPGEPRPGSSLYRAWQAQQVRGARVRFLKPLADSPGTLHTAWPGGTVTLVVAGESRRLVVVAQGQGPPQTLTIERQESGRCRIDLSQPGLPPRTLEVIPTFHRRVIPIAAGPSLAAPVLAATP